MKKSYRRALVTLVATLVLCVVAYFATRPPWEPLTAAESILVGSWAFISPDHDNKTAIVYHFASDRRVREEHYYLTSASPKVPRMTMVGRWGVEEDGRLTVEPDSGLSYTGDSISGWLSEYLDDGRQAWAKRILTRFYSVRSATTNGIHVDCTLSGGGQTSISMLPFAGDPTAVQSD